MQQTDTQRDNQFLSYFSFSTDRQTDLSIYLSIYLLLSTELIYSYSGQWKAFDTGRGQNILEFSICDTVENSAVSLTLTYIHTWLWSLGIEKARYLILHVTHTHTHIGRMFLGSAQISDLSLMSYISSVTDREPENESMCDRLSESTQWCGSVRS